MNKKLFWLLSNSGNRLLTSLVSYWSFDSDGTDAKGVNNSTFQGGAASGAGGILSNGLVLSGTSQWTQIADNDSLSFGNNVVDSPFSYSFWYKPTNFTQQAYVIAKRNTSNYEYHIAIKTTAKLSFALFSQKGAVAYLALDSIQSLTSGAWNHCVCTYNGNSAESGIKLYINGTLCTTTSLSSGSYVAMNNGTSVLDIGAAPDAPTTTECIGTIDEVGLWSKELSQTDVTRLYNSGAGLPYSSFQ